MAIAIGRFGRGKRWIVAQIKSFFVFIWRKIMRAIRGPRPENNDIALEVNPEMDFQVSVHYQLLAKEHLYNIIFQMLCLYFQSYSKLSLFLGRKW